jgi:tRNA(Ile)-lysidine synthase
MTFVVRRWSFVLRMPGGAEMHTASVQRQVKSTIDDHRILETGEVIVVGVSGGADSLCLLHVLRELAPAYAVHLHVAHLDHGIRGAESAADAAFVTRLAADWGLPATIEKADVPAYARRRKLAIEEAARQARYAFLAQVSHAIGARKAAVAHNADDQVETVIMHWLRGSGLAGLRGMQPVSPWPEQPVDDPYVIGMGGASMPAQGDHEGSLLLVRLLLEVPRTAIDAYCREQGLEPRFDLSNLDQTYYRNRLRHELIPLLETYNPGIRQVVRRMAWVIADDYDYLRRQGEAAWQRLAVEGEDWVAFDLAGWRELHASLQRHLLREAVRRLRRALRNIDFIHIENALAVARDKPTGTAATLPQGLQLFVDYDRLIVAEIPPVLPDLPQLAVEEMALNVPGVTPLPGSAWQVEADVLARERLSGGELVVGPWQAMLDAERVGPSLVMRRRRPGDRFQPMGLGGHEMKLNEFMINVKLSAVARAAYPLVASPAHIVWLPGYRVDERARVTPETRQVLRLTLHPAVCKSKTG